MTCPEDQSALVARGVVGAPKFCKEVQDKFLANEEENAYVQLEVMGDPPPKPQWFMGDTPLMENDRFKSWTDGKKGLVLFGIENCKKEDEGIYRCIITNRFGKREHKFKLYIAGANGITGWIVRRKDPPKREVPLYWTDTPRNKCIKLGAESVSFTAKLTVNDKKAVWFFEEQECISEDKYEFIQANGSHTIKIKNPTLEDTGNYNCVLVNCDGMSCQTYLDVQVPDPEHRITRKLEIQGSGYSLRPLQLKCLTSLGAKVAWLKNGQEIFNDRIIVNEEEGEHTLFIARPTKSDSGSYTCNIVKYGVEGESQTSCRVDISDFPHKFVQKLEEVNTTERSSLELEVTTTEEDAIVSWYNDGHQVTVERKRNQRLQICSKGRVRRLTINDCTVKDAGVYSAKTNADDTSCKVNISAFAHKFASQLQETLNVIEESKATFEVATEHEDAEVKWFHNNTQFIPERSRIARIQIQTSGNKRTLTIKKCTPKDTAKIEARTNMDSTACNFIVKCYNAFENRLPDASECSERQQMEFDVCVRDITAPVTFCIDKVPVDTSDGRIELINNGDGEHILVINKVLITDAGLISCRTPSNRGDEMLECRGIFNVIQGESEPIIEAVEPVCCVAILHSYRERTNAYIHKEQCRIVIPYRIEGERQSNLEIFVEKDGKEIEIGNEIRMKVTKDKVMVDVINPQREMSGVYKITMKNDVGVAEVSVPVEVMDHPSPPMDVNVTDIFKDHITVNWKSPRDDGGSPIKRYVIDVLDFTTNNMWTPVTMSETGQDNSTVVYNLIPGHRYCFRVSCANKVGVSDPTDMWETDIITKDPWDVPTSCGKAEVIDWTPSFADITWKPPDKNGGADISSYIIEYKETNMRNWLEGVEIPAEELDIWEDKLMGRCENLEEEYEYRFRVTAVNKGGRSEPGPPSSPIIAMHKNIPPYIKGGGLFDLTIKEGRAIRFDVWFGGEPAPVPEWIKDGYPLVNDGTLAIDTYTKNSVYTLKNAVISIPNALEERDSGVYKLRLKNECGVFESAANIKVEGLPGKKKLLQPKPKEEEVVLEEEKEEIVINRKLSDIKHDGKDDDKDSGLKIGEESCNDTEEEYEWTENSYDDEDFYEDEGSDGQSIDHEITSFHIIKEIINHNNCQQIENKNADITNIEDDKTNMEINSNNKDAFKSTLQNSSSMKYSEQDSEESDDQCNIYEKNLKNSELCNIPCDHIQDQETNVNEEIITQLDINQKLIVIDNTGDNHERSNSDICIDGYNNSWISESGDNSANIVSVYPPLIGPTNTNEAETSTSHYGQPLDSSTTRNEIENTSCNEQYRSNMNLAHGNESTVSVTEQNLVSSSTLNTSESLLPIETEVSTRNNESKAIDDIEINQQFKNVKASFLVDAINDSSSKTCKDIMQKDKEEKEMTIAKEKEAYHIRMKEKEAERKAKEEAERKVKEEAKRNRENKLNTKLTKLGFLKSETVDMSLMSSGDGCLIALLDQMKQENQDFKVWDREDFSFLRWYICKQMETYICKGLNLKFTQDMDIDPMSYVERVENDGEYLDNIFLQATASIFNKDIVIISTDEDNDYVHLKGGPEGTRGKGSPLYLAHLKDSDTNRNNYSSILPNLTKYNRILNELDGSIVQPTPSIEADKIEVDNTINCSASEEVNIEDTDQSLSRVGSRKWKRMDSYSGSNTHELDKIITSIKNEGGLEELQHSLDKCESEQEEDDECFDMLTDFGAESRKNKYVEEYEEVEQSTDIVDCEEDNWEYDDGWEYEDDDEVEKNTTETLQSKYSMEKENNLNKSVENLDIDQKIKINREIETNVDAEEDVSLSQREMEIEENETVDNEQTSLSKEGDNQQVFLNSQNKCETSEDDWEYEEEWEYEDDQEEEQLAKNITHTESHNEECSEQYTKIISENTFNEDNFDRSIELLNMNESMQLNDENGVDFKTISIKEAEDPNFYTEEAVNIMPDIEQVAKEPNNAAKSIKKIKIKISVSNENYNLSSNYPNQEELNDNLNNKEENNNKYTDNSRIAEIENKNNKIFQVSDSLENESKSTCQEIITIDHVKEKEKEALDIILGVCDHFQKEIENRDQENNNELDTVDNNNKIHNSKNIIYELAKSKSQTINHCLNKSQSQSEIKKAKSNTGINQLNKSNSQNKINPIDTSNPQHKDNKIHKLNSQSTGTINNTEMISNKEIKSCSHINHINLDQTDSQTNEFDISLPFGSNNQPDVKMRKTLKYEKRKNSASFRWSGSEMFQVEGPDATIDPSHEEQVKSLDVSTTPAVGQPSLQEREKCLEEKLKNIGFIYSPTLTNKEIDSSNCLRALLDQMTRPTQDFKVWDRDDHSFLRWYIVKQMEIHISTGRSTSYMKNLTETPNEYVARILKDEEYVDNTFLHAVAKVFNKDIIVIPYAGDIEHVIHIKGGRNDTPGRGMPLFLSYMDKETFSSDIYQSIVPEYDHNINLLLEKLKIK